MDVTFENWRNLDQFLRLVFDATVQERSTCLEFRAILNKIPAVNLFLKLYLWDNCPVRERSIQMDFFHTMMLLVARIYFLKFISFYFHSDLKLIHFNFGSAF